MNHKPQTNLLSYPLTWLVRLLSKLPLWVLHGFSAVFYFLMAHVVRYRRRVVMSNLRTAFPRMNEGELRRVCRRFYRNLADVTAETIKLLTISDKEALRRCRFSKEGHEKMMQYYKEGQSLIGVLGHTGNWEWLGPMVTLHLPFPLIPVYRPMKDKVMDRLLLQIRGRYTYEMVPKMNTGRAMMRYRKMDKPYFMCLVADQTPHPENAYWTDFLGQDTPFYTGPEKLAKTFKMPVFFVALRREKRGHYYMHTELLSEKPWELAEGALTQMFVDRLEIEIQRQPAHWLWSHRRWKHKRSTDTERLLITSSEPKTSNQQP
jgi:Kdo2-lipid IVA lauroyltransferase/acyltransferase